MTAPCIQFSVHFVHFRVGNAALMQNLCVVSAVLAELTLLFKCIDLQWRLGFYRFQLGLNGMKSEWFLVHPEVSLLHVSQCKIVTFTQWKQVLASCTDNKLEPCPSTLCCSCLLLTGHIELTLTSHWPLIDVCPDITGLKWSGLTGDIFW